MSMYIISDEDYQEFATMLTQGTGQHAIYWTLGLEANSQSDENVQAIRQFVNRVIALNHIAAFGRYNDAIDPKLITSITELKASANIFDQYAFFRLISSIVYNCSEDWAVETDTYKKLQEIKWRLADNIAQGVVYE